GFILRLGNTVGRVILKEQLLALRRNHFLEIPLSVSVENNSMPSGIRHHSRCSLSAVFGEVRLGKIEFAAVAEGQRPAISVPRDLGAVKLRGSFFMAENGIGISGSLGNPPETKPAVTFQIDIHVGVRISGSGWADVIGMVAADSKGPA